MKIIKPNKKEKFAEMAVAVILIAIAVFARILPHPANFTPLAAIALFGGVYLPRKMALILPLVAMVISDMFIGTYELKLMIFVYGSFLLSVILGFWLKKHKKWYNIGGSAVISSVLFFLITNFAVWAFTPWYSRNLSGLIECFTLALPFFRNTLLGDLFYVGVFFGLYELAKIYVRKFFLKESLISVK